MVKGVNKSIIEINNPDSIYFEKAVLYVRPNVTVFPEAVRRKEAERLLNTLLPDKKTGKGRRIKRFIILSLISVLCLLILLLMH